MSLSRRGHIYFNLCVIKSLLQHIISEKIRTHLFVMCFSLSRLGSCLLNEYFGISFDCIQDQFDHQETHTEHV